MRRNTLINFLFILIAVMIGLLVFTQMMNGGLKLDDKINYLTRATTYSPFDSIIHDIMRGTDPDRSFESANNNLQLIVYHRNLTRRVDSKLIAAIKSVRGVIDVQESDYKIVITRSPNFSWSEILHFQTTLSKDIKR